MTGQAAFASAAAVAGRAPARTRGGACGARASVADQYYPKSVRNAAPHISFSGESGVFMSMARVKAFTEETGEPPLFDYYDKNWSDGKPSVKGPVCWPAGDGRDVEMKGTRGSYNVMDEKEYQEAPPGGFFKRSMDG